MKRCPSCQQTYDEDALSFCPADGTRLENERIPSHDLLQATIMAPPPSAPPALSQPLSPESLSGYETNVSPSVSSFETTTPPTQTPSWESLPGASSTPQQAVSPAQGMKPPKPMVAYITIGAAIVVAGFLLLVWLIGLIAGVGGGFIHLLFLLALLIGFIGIAAGVAMLVMGKKS
jgi:hypothetical protein